MFWKERENSFINIIGNLRLSNVAPFFSIFKFFCIFSEDIWEFRNFGYCNSALHQGIISEKFKNLCIQKCIFLNMTWGLLFISLQVNSCKIHEINISWLCQVGLILQAFCSTLRACGYPKLKHNLQIIDEASKYGKCCTLT